MNAFLSNRAFSSSESINGFVAMLIHDGPVARRQVESLFSRLDRSVEPGPIRESWRLEQFEQPDAAAEACQRAAEADLLIIATSRRVALPIPFPNWIHAWLINAARRDAALVVLVGQPASGASADSAIHRSLRAAAEAAGVPCFLGEFLLEPDPPHAVEVPMIARAKTVTTTMEKILYCPQTRYWGINE